jgi:hypothetical protein
VKLLDFFDNSDDLFVKGIKWEIYSIYNEEILTDNYSQIPLKEMRYLDEVEVCRSEFAKSTMKVYVDYVDEADYFDIFDILNILPRDCLSVKFPTDNRCIFLPKDR